MGSLSINSRKNLRDHVKIPYLGLGVFQTPVGKITYDAVLTALKCGYRHIDTARIYQNESDVGRAVKESGINRSEIFITTKLWNQDQGYDSALKAFDSSLKSLGLEYIDLYLLHWPVYEKRLESWKALEKLKAEGLVKTIGVSNFMIHHLKELLDNCKEIPSVNQVEFHPYLYKKDLLNFCNDHEITIEAYAPLTKGIKLSDPPLVKIAKKHKKNTAQILIRWALEHQLVVLPKSARPDRIKENANVFNFELDFEDMLTLDELNEDLVTSWDPTDAP